MPTVKFQLRRDTAANWASVNPTLGPGEPALEIDTLKVKYGNGVNAWNDLPYAAVDLPAVLEAYATGDTPSAFTLSIVDSPSAAAWRVAIGAVATSLTLTAGSGLSGGGDLSTNRSFTVATNGVADTMMRQSAAFSVIGRSANTTGNVADITASTDGHVLRRSGSVMEFGPVDLSIAGGTAGILPVSKGGTGATSSTGSGGNVQATRPQFTNTIGVGAAASTSGAGVSFPATQSPSTDPNTLDDYEEGTYTPTVSAASGALTSYTASGTYTKIGRLVTVTVDVSITNNGTGAIALLVSLPFTNGGASYVGCGRERLLTGNLLQAAMAPGDGSFALFTYNNGYPGGTGSNALATITYTV